MRKVNGSINTTNQSDQRGNFYKQTFEETSDKPEQQYRSNDNIKYIHKKKSRIVAKDKALTMKNTRRRIGNRPLKNVYICTLKIRKQKMARDLQLKQEWESVVKFLSDKFADGDTLDLDSIIYLIGVQELGKGVQKFKKDEKINLMHIAICRLLEPYGYYEFEFIDPDGWPHYKVLEELPVLKPGEQTVLMKEAIVKYFSSEEAEA